MLEPLSPELALVDPELAARARAALPEPLVEALPAPAAAVPRARAGPAPGRLARFGRAGMLALLVASLALNVDLLNDRRTAGMDAAGTTQPFVPSVVATAKRTVHKGAVKGAQAVKRGTRTRAAAGTTRAPPRAVVRTALSWPKAPAAVAYDVVLWRGHTRVLDVWTARSRLELADLSCAQKRKLVPGRRYLWFVYPALGTKASSRFGPLLEWGALRAPGPRTTRCP